MRSNRRPSNAAARSPIATRRRAVRLLTAAALLASGTLARSARADVYTFSNPNGGAINVSTNFTPVGVPGSSDTILIDDLSRIFTNMTLTVPVNQTIFSLTYSHYGQTTINGPGTLTLQNGNVAFGDAITETPGAPLTSLFINAPITSGTTLKKSGVGFALIGSTNTSAGVTIDVGTAFSNIVDGQYLGGLTVASDAALGAAGTTLTLTTGGTLRATSGFTTSRTINIGTTGGRIESYGNLILNGPVTGSAPLVVGGLTGGSVTFGGNLSNTSGLYVVGGATATLFGSVSASSPVTVAGTLNLGSATTGPAANALGDSALFTSGGGSIALFARTGNTNESTGLFAIAGGTTTLDLNPNVNAGVQLNFSSFSRNAKGTLFVRGRDLGGGALTANRALLTGNSYSGLTAVGGGGTTATNASIVPWIVGDADATGGISQVSVVEAGLVTIGANGLRALGSADYATTIGTNATDNVRISNGVTTVNSAATLNALVVRDTMSSSGNTGVTGSGALTINSGAIVAVSDLQGEELFIDNPLNFGSAEGVVHTLPTADGDSTLTLRGAITGSGGLTKAGNGDLYLTNTASTYTGNTTISAGSVIFSGDIPATGASALGASNNITLTPGNNGNQYTELLAGTPNSVVSRTISILPTTGANGRVLIGTAGGVGTVFNGAISLGSTLNLLGDADPANVLTFNGNIATGQGIGALQEPAVAFPQFQYLRLTGNNSYTGGTIIRAAEWQVGSDTALGINTIFFAGNNAATQTGAISAFGGDRALSNPLTFRAAPIFSGTYALTFAGAVDLGSVNREIYITNTTADTKFTGVVGRGGVIKRGAGRLILASNNTYNGQTIVFEGQLRAAADNALGVAIGTANPNQGTFIINTGSLELANNITTTEAIFLGAGNNPITAANPLGNLRSVSGANTINESIAYDNVGTVGVDTGSTLTLTGDTIDNTTNTTAALRKVGGGTLSVKNVRLNTLDVQGGTVRITPGTVPTSTSRVSALNVASGALLDLTNAPLIYDYTTASPQSAVRATLFAGSIKTSTEGAGGAVGYAEATDYFAAGTTFPQNFAGQVVDNTTLLLIPTLAGDATLNKTVDFADLLALAKNYGGTGKTWVQGDFDYDGTVGFSDLLALAKSYNGTAPAADAATLSGDPSFAADWSLAQSLVPEPIALGALTMLLPLVRRRRHG